VTSNRIGSTPNAASIRVSTKSQTTDNQRLKLEEVARRSGWDVVEVYEDEGISGSRGRDKRPAFDAMCKAAARREFDVVLAWSVCRLGRSLQDLVPFLNDLHAVGVDLYLDQQAIDTTTPSGKAMFHMVGVFAEFERSMIQERIHAGLDRAGSQGKTLGRRKELDEGTAKAIREAKAGGASFRAVAKEFGVTPSMVQRVVKAA
jgi:DNA invertase Pin-like site-specific DNA recombinase